jgi:class 3 adenylate cyclase
VPATRTPALLASTLRAVAHHLRPHPAPRTTGGPAAHANPDSTLITPAVHRTIICVDVEGFTGRSHPHQLTVRHGLYQSLRTAFTCTHISWDDGCYHEDRGDGALILIPPAVPKSLLAARLPHHLATALATHNRTHPPAAHIRLRLALHAGEIHHDSYGVTGTALNTAFRLLDAPALKHAHATSTGALTVITSSWFYDEVTRHTLHAHPATHRPTIITSKETTTAWISRPDDPYPPDNT